MPGISIHFQKNVLITSELNSASVRYFRDLYPHSFIRFELLHTNVASRIQILVQFPLKSVEVGHQKAVQQTSALQIQMPLQIHYAFEIKNPETRLQFHLHVNGN